MKKLFFCVGVWLLSWPSFAIEPIIFGLEIGAPLKLPACTYELQYVKKEMCADLDHITRQVWGNDVIEINASDWPRYVRHNSVFVGLTDGLIGSITFSTYGEESQAAVFKALREKFGKPTSQHTTPVQNRMAAKFIRLDANWVQKLFTVKLAGITEGLDWGSVEIKETNYDKRYMAWKKSNPEKKM